MSRILAVAVGAFLTIALGVAPGRAQTAPKAYITDWSNANSVKVIDTGSNTVTTTIRVGGEPFGVSVSVDGTKVYVTNYKSNTVSAIDTASDSVIATIPVGTQPEGLAVTPDGSKVYVANTKDSTVSVIDTASNSVIATVAVTSPVGVAADPRSSEVYVTSEVNPGTVYVIDTTNDKINNTIAVGPYPRGVTFSSGGSTAYVANSGANYISVIDTKSGAVTATITTGQSPTGVAAAPDTPGGSVVYVVNFGVGGAGNLGSLSVIDAESNTVIDTITLGNEPYGVSVTPDGSTVYVVNSNGSFYPSPGSVWAIDASTDKVVATVDGGVFPVAFGNFIGGGTPALTVAVTGTGVGTVTSEPAGIDCPGTCKANFPTGTLVTLTASAVSGSTFSGWTGDECSGTDDCVLTLDASTTVTANFDTDVIANLTLVAAVLPLSRSVEIGKTATAFATMIDTGPADAVTCAIAPATSVPASFVYQTTDPTTNALTGTANTPANIAAGQSQSFVIGLTPTAAFAPTNLSFTFNCANSPAPAMTTVGVDTLNLSASATPVPDVVALAASSDPGYVDIPGATGTGDFAVATVNLGSDATITAAANTGSATLPVTLTLCETNPASGACLAAPAASVTTDIAPNATPTFGVFVTGAGTVADMPGANRVFVTFTDSGGTLRGETSVAVRTQ